MGLFHVTSHGETSTDTSHARSPRDASPPTSLRGAPEANSTPHHQQRPTFSSSVSGKCSPGFTRRILQQATSDKACNENGKSRNQAHCFQSQSRHMRHHRRRRERGDRMGGFSVYPPRGLGWHSKRSVFDYSHVGAVPILHGRWEHGHEGSIDQRDVSTITAGTVFIE
ncbi:hypothetical protein LZ32DRAFT_696665, partial [Colletotrichum eremochloae]